MESAAIKYLAQDEVAHMDMLEPIRRGTADLVMAIENEGVLLFEREAGAYMMSATSVFAAEALLQKADTITLAAVHQLFAVEMVAQSYSLRQTMQCHQAVWTRIRPPDIPISPLDCRVLSLDFAEEVHAVYSHDIGIAYLRDRLLAGEMLGAFSGKTLVGFIGLHAEGSMGMLEVKPAFRRQGVGRQLIASLSGRLLAAGRTPFSQFVVKNAASQSLHASMGFTISETLVYWLEP